MDNQPREYSVKKQLMAGTALVAATMFIAGGAVAAEKKMMKPSISVGGFAEHVIGGVLDSSQTNGGGDATPNYAALDVRNNVEVHFNGRATLDSGIKIHARVELEGSTHTGAPAPGQMPNPGAHFQPSPANSDDQIDEMFLAISGSFGQVILGPTENAPVKMLTRFTGSWATNVGWNQTFNSHSFVGPSVGGGAAFHTMQQPQIASGDQEKVTYISPKFDGVQIGFSYTPNDAEDNGTNSNTDTQLHDGIAGAISYAGKFSGVGVGGGIGYSQMQGAGGNEDQIRWGAAGMLDFGGGFRVAVAYKANTSPMASEGHVFDGGVRYIAGANSFSVTGSVGENDTSGAEYRTVIGSYRRTLGPGVRMFGSMIWNDSDSGNGMTERSGLAAVTGVFVGF